MQSYKPTKKRVKELMCVWINTKHRIYSETKRTTDVLDYDLKTKFMEEMTRCGIEVADDDSLRDLVYRIMPRIVFFADERGFVKLLPLFLPFAFEQERDMGDDDDAK